MILPDETLRALIGYCLHRAQASTNLRFKTALAAHGLRRTTFSCLSLIIENPGLKQGQLGEALAIERPNLVKIVEDLTCAGLIRRETSKTDSRAYALYPTDEGTARFTEAMVTLRMVDTVVTEGLNAAEVAALRSALEKVEKNASRISEAAD